MLTVLTRDSRKPTFRRSASSSIVLFLSPYVMMFAARSFSSSPPEEKMLTKMGVRFDTALLLFS